MSNFMVGGLLLALVFFGVAVGVFLGWMCRSDQTAIVEGRLKNEQEDHAECRSHRLAEAHEAGKLRHSNVELQARLNRARGIVYESNVIRHASCFPQLCMLLDPESVARAVDRYASMLAPELKISTEDWTKAQQQAREIFDAGLQNISQAENDGKIIPLPKSW